MRALGFCHVGVRSAGLDGDQWNDASSAEELGGPQNALLDGLACGKGVCGGTFVELSRVPVLAVVSADCRVSLLRFLFLLVFALPTKKQKFDLFACCVVGVSLGQFPQAFRSRILTFFFKMENMFLFYSSCPFASF